VQLPFLQSGNYLRGQDPYPFVAVSHTRLRLCAWAFCKHVKLFSGAGALGLPWQTQCNEAMLWKGKHDLISHVYLRNHLHDDETVLWVPFGFRVVKLLSPHLLESQDETWLLMNAIKCSI